MSIRTKPYIFRRILALFFDYGLIFSYFFAMIYFFGEQDELSFYSVDGLPALSIILVWVFLTIGVEQLNGATIGNWIVGLKPVDKVNVSLPITLGQSVKRHLLDPFDFQGLGLISILCTKNHQRLGDLWAGTIVVDAKEVNNDN